MVMRTDGPNINGFVKDSVVVLNGSVLFGRPVATFPLMSIEMAVSLLLKIPAQKF